MFNKYILAPLILALSGTAQAVTVDTVLSFSGGTSSGVFVASGATWGGPSGNGTFDQNAVTALDGVSLALGGTAASPGQITVGFSSGSVIDGAGIDLRTYDTIGLSEGVTVEASADGINFFSIGSEAGDFSVSCSPTLPCVSGFDLATAGLLSASIFRLTVSGAVVTGFPQAYDFDTLEAVNFSTSAVPVPAAVWLFGTALLGLIGFGKRKRAA